MSGLYIGSIVDKTIDCRSRSSALGQSVYQSKIEFGLESNVG